MSKAPLFGATYVPFGAEVDVRDCPVTGKIPENLSGGFYAVGSTPEEFAAFLKQDYEYQGRLMEDLGLKAK